MEATIEPAAVNPDQLRRIELFGMRIHAIRLREATRQILDWTSQPFPESCRYVVTPNLDHAVMWRENEKLREAYSEADLILADGFPLITASRLFGCPLPERVAGSDLVPSLFAEAGHTACPKNAREMSEESTSQGMPPLRCYLLGAAPGVGVRAAARIRAQWPWIEIAGNHSPPLGFENNSVLTEEIIRRVEDAEPDVLIIGFGSPKQEIWTHANHDRLRAKVAICAGATIDFLAGEKRRAPNWMRKSGFEWFHRLASEPRRLGGRYARDAWILPQLLWQQWRSQR